MIKVNLQYWKTVYLVKKRKSNIVTNYSLVNYYLSIIVIKQLFEYHFNVKLMNQA